jgi:hypothetical protein
MVFFPERFLLALVPEEEMGVTIVREDMPVQIRLLVLQLYALEEKVVAEYADDGGHSNLTKVLLTVSSSTGETLQLLAAV